MFLDPLMSLSILSLHETQLFSFLTDFGFKTPQRVQVRLVYSSVTTSTFTFWSFALLRSLCLNRKWLHSAIQGVNIPNLCNAPFQPKSLLVPGLF
jgi:hypothetical protein